MLIYNNRNIINYTYNDNIVAFILNVKNKCFAEPFFISINLNKKKNNNFIFIKNLSLLTRVV